MTAATYYGNPMLEALADLVNGYDEDTQQVPLVAINSARRVLGLPPVGFTEGENECRS